MKTAAVPYEIRRNTWLLFAAQALMSSGLSMAAQLGSLIVYALTQSKSLAGLPMALHYVAIASIAYPAGRFMDRRGRRPGLVLGYVIAGVGAAVVGAAVSGHVFAAYIFGLIVLSLGAGMAQLTRAAVADMYPVERRAAALGLVVAGGLIGGIIGPGLVALGDRVAPAVGGDPLAIPYLVLVGALALAAATASRLRPDPREISRRLAEYFPDSAPGDLSPAAAENATVSQIVGSPPAQAAMVALACAQAAMAMLMATSSLMMHLHGHSISAISLALMAHVLGMFALSVPIGRLADRVGRTPVLIGGALLTASSGLVFTLGVESAVVSSIAFYLVGLGWSLTFVSGAALLGDLSGPATRARVMGINDLFTNLTAMTAALLGGVFLARGGETAVGVVAALLGSIPLLAILRAARAAVPSPAIAAATGGDGK
jgi:MFS family permease